MPEPWDKVNRRISRETADQLEIEIHAERLRVWVDGASMFLATENNQKVLIELMVKALDQWADIRRKAILERLGLYAAIAILSSFLGYLGWKGWATK